MELEKLTDEQLYNTYYYARFNPVADWPPGRSLEIQDECHHEMEKRCGTASEWARRLQAARAKEK